MGTLTAQIQLTEAELKLLQTLVYQECGMFFDERRSHFLKDRLQRRVKACQLDSFYSYYRLLTSREGKNELALLLENLTVNGCASGARAVRRDKRPTLSPFLFVTRWLTTICATRFPSTCLLRSR